MTSLCSRRSPSPFEDNVVLDRISFRLPRGENKGCLRGRRLWEKHDPEAGPGADQARPRTHLHIGRRHSPPCRRSNSSNFAARWEFVFQESALFDSLTVRDNVALPADGRSHGRPRRDRAARPAKPSVVELEHTLDMFPRRTLGRHAPAGCNRSGHHHATRDSTLRTRPPAAWIRSLRPRSSS